MYSVEQDRNRLLYRAVERAVVATILLSAALAATLTFLDYISGVRAAIWMAAVVIVGVYRLSLRRAYQGEAEDPLQAEKWARRFVLGTGLAGLTWGLAALFLFPSDIVGQLFMAFTFAGVSAGSITTVGPSRRASAVFLVLTLLPLAGQLLLSAGLIANVMGWMTLVFLAYLIASSSQIAGVLSENYRLRLADASREISLTRQRDLLERVGRMAAVGGWTFDARSEKLEWSREVFRIYGMEDGEPPALEVALEPYVGEARRTIDEALARATEKGVAYDVEVPFVSFDGRELWVRAQGQPEFENGELVRIVGTFQDITDRRRAKADLSAHLTALQRLYHITSDTSLTLPQKLDGILDLGLELFDLDLGIVSRIDGDEYTVLAARGEGEIPPIGTTFDLGDTYCLHTLQADAPTSFHHTAVSEIRNHPCYLKFGLEAYIGSPVVIEGRRVGTINFSAADPRATEFSDSDHAIVQVLAEWIGFEIEREQGIVRLAESEERVRLLLESVGDGVYGLDLGGRGTFVNPAALSILGYTSDEVIGEPMHDLVQHSRPDGSPYPLEESPTYQTLVEGVVQRSREVLWRSDGSRVPTDMTSTPILKDGRIVGAVIAFRDITRREEYERRLTSTLAMQGAMLDSANYAIIATDVDGIVRMFSRGAERMLGYSDEEVVGEMSPFAFHDPQEIAVRGGSRDKGRSGTGSGHDFGRFVDQLELRQNAYEGEWTYVRKDGTRLPVLLSITSVRDDSGELIGYLCIAADLTERKRVDQLKNEFVSTVSHELRTPLTSIRGSLGLVAGGAAGELPPRAKSLIDIAARNSERLILLINDILDMEKIESGKIDISLSTQPLGPIVEQVVQANEAFAAEHEVTLDFAPLDEEIFVTVDEHRLNQVLTNLLSNAAKFSRDGTAVEVRIHPDPSRVRISVTDRGPGISDEFRTRIFEKFSQADGSDRRTRGGTGLGLSITRALVERMDGRIGFETSVGEGSTFWVEFSRTPAPGQRDLQTGRVLICSGDPDAAAVCHRVDRAGHSCRLVDSPEDAIRAVEDEHFDAFVIDLTFSDGGGAKLVRWLRQRPETAESPIIALSASADNDRVELGGDGALVDMLDAPLDRQKLIATIDRLAETRGRLPAVLHVEDDDDLQRMVAELGRGVARFESAASVAEARRALAERRFDLILLDIGLPDGSGWEVLEDLTQAGSTTPVVVFSADVNGESSHRVAATLLKSQVSEREVLATLEALLSQRAE